MNQEGLPFIRKLLIETPYVVSYSTRLCSIDQPVLFQFVLQRPPANPKGTGGILPVAGDMRQGLAYQHLLYFSQGRARAHGEGGCVAVVIAQEIR